MSQQGENKKHTCVLCNSKLDSKEALQEHFRKHANKEIDNKGRPFKQNQPTRIVKPPVVNRPVAAKSPAKGEPIICDVCGQEFENVTVAIQHKFRKHPESAAKHFCPHCGMQFPLKINRDKHLADHPNEKPATLYPCEDCGVVFYNTGAHSYHVKSTHKRIVAFFRPIATPPPSKKIKVNNAGEAQSAYYCHLCGFEYIMKFNLQKHLESQHTEEERNRVPEDLIKCTTCDALFYRKRAYDNHNMYHQPGDLYVTSEEQRLQTVTRIDQDFDIRRVQSTAEKFIPVYRRPNKPSQLPKKKLKISAIKKENEKRKTEDLSSDSGSESSDPESSIPLIERLNKLRATPPNSLNKV